MKKILLSVSLFFAVVSVRAQNGNASKFSSENQYASHNLMSPTAFGVKKGEAYYKNTELLINSIHCGITDHFSVGLSMDILGPLAGKPPHLMTFNTKFSTHLSKNAAIAGGFTLVQTRPVFTFGNETEDNNTSKGIVYSVATFGNKNTNLTVGGGYSTSLNKNTQPNQANSILFTVSGQYRLSEHAALITENWLASTDGKMATIGAMGGRFMHKGFAVDIAIPYAVGTLESGVSSIPYIALTIPFKTK